MVVNLPEPDASDVSVGVAVATYTGERKPTMKKRRMHAMMRRSLGKAGEEESSCMGYART
tara:strand:+ start:178 stop:357 length:180 start_codon:yes stop_codon:yes gene_type:complete